MNANQPITVKLTRETKNTYRYDAVDEDAPVGNIYIQEGSAKLYRNLPLKPTPATRTFVRKEV